jgi:hypothetical protein
MSNDFTERDTLDLMREDASAPVDLISEANLRRLGEVSRLIEERDQLCNDLERLAKLSEAATARVREIEGVRIPEIFESVGLSEVQLHDGSRVSVKLDWAAGLTERTAPAGFAWLREHGHDGLITREFKVVFKRNQQDEARKFLRILRDQRVTYKDKESVNPQTLKAFVREQLKGEDAASFPRETFNVFEIKSTVIKR